jgi:hypothetical protein
MQPTEPSFWEKHKNKIIVAVIVAILLVILLIIIKAFADGNKSSTEIQWVKNAKDPVISFSMGDQKAGVCKANINSGVGNIDMLGTYKIGTNDICYLPDRRTSNDFMVLDGNNDYEMTDTANTFLTSSVLSEETLKSLDETNKKRLTDGKFKMGHCFAYTDPAHKRPGIFAGDKKCSSVPIADADRYTVKYLTKKP